VEGFAPERPDSRFKLLVCGEETMQAMLAAIKAARHEIAMCWWEFLLDLPAVRGDAGPAAWSDPAGLLLPTLTERAEAGVKGYIQLVS
jgi:phosphatidylserine/phosphatidylglycerophosphate/cardiolipin synthase-like enzyme